MHISHRSEAYHTGAERFDQFVCGFSLVILLVMSGARPRRPRSLRRVFSVFTVGFIVVMAVLGGITVYRIQSILERQEETFQRQLVERIEGYLQQRARTATLLIRYLYADRFYLEEIGRLLDGGYADYLEYRLRAFAGDEGFAVRSIERYFNLYRDIHPDISSIVLSNVSNEYAYRFDDSGTRIADPEEVRFKLDYTADNPNGRLLAAHPTARGTDEWVFGFVFPLPDPLTGEPIGRLFVDFNVDSIENTYTEHASNLNSSIYILNRSDDLVFDGTGRYDPEVVEALLPTGAAEQNRAGRGFRESSTEHIVLGVPVSEFGGTIIARIDRSAIARETAPVMASIAVFLGLAVVVGFVLLSNLRNRVEGEVTTILHGLGRIQAGEFDIALPRLGSLEFDQVARGVEGMGEQLSEYIRRAFLYRLEERNAELNFLQEQVNPHFLYNTLEAIRMKAVTDGSEETAEMLYALGTLFRRMVKDSRVVVPLREELEFTEEYVKLFTVRHQGRLGFDIRVSERATELGVPKLLLQPLVENYIVHGFSTKQKENRLLLIGAVEDEQLRLELTDNGRGVSRERRETIRHQLLEKRPTGAEGVERSVGLSNVHRRLLLAFPDAARVEFDSAEGEGTTVRLTIPAMSVTKMREYVQSAGG